mmetsp:Transcript_74073/g.239494  ORF Transcript_74073/g.239494 Transcript_74073/m.239494 type:complete len:240 (+) Transcript_74073:88-807(+)
MGSALCAQQPAQEVERITVRTPGPRTSVLCTPGMGQRATVMHGRTSTMPQMPAANELEDLLLQQAADMDATMPIPTIALIAHDNMKKMMRQFVKVHLEMLQDFNLTGTGTTCAMLRELGLEPIGATVSGPLGGDQQIGAMIVAGDAEAVFFFRDPFSAHAHIADIEALSRLGNCYQVYYGSNYRSCSAVLNFMHSNLKSRQFSGKANTVRLPEGVDNLAEAVQSDYKSTRAAALSKSKA